MVFRTGANFSCHWSLSILCQNIRKSLVSDIFRGYWKRPEAWKNLADAYCLRCILRNSCLKTLENQQEIVRCGVCYSRVKHCMKSIRIRSFSGPYSVRIRENTEQKNSKYERFSYSWRASVSLENGGSTT